MMDNLEGQVIGVWRLNKLIKCTDTSCVYEVNLEEDKDRKYFMSILCNDGDSSVVATKDSLDSPAFRTNADLTYCYYDAHCFPIVPLNGGRGHYKGHRYFVYERVTRELSSILVDSSLHVTRDDLVNIAIQILVILQHLFKDGQILKDLTVDDFFLRRTTKGYRVILLNQDFYTGHPLSISDTTFVSPSILHGNEPTMRDNVISVVYIMLYLMNASLPWTGKKEEEAMSLKMDEDVIYDACGDDFAVLYGMSQKFNLHSKQVPQLDPYIDALRSMTTTRNITFGSTLSRYAKRKGVPPLMGERPKEESVYLSLGEVQEVKEEDQKEENGVENDALLNPVMEEHVNEPSAAAEHQTGFEDHSVDTKEQSEDEESEKARSSAMEPSSSEPLSQLCQEMVNLESIDLPRKETVKRESPQETDNREVSDEGSQKRVKRHRLTAHRTWSDRFQEFISSSTFANLIMLSGTLIASEINF